jgi:hypothetical protein
MTGNKATASVSANIRVDLMVTPHPKLDADAVARHIPGGASLFTPVNAESGQAAPHAYGML